MKQKKPTEEQKTEETARERDRLLELRHRVKAKKPKFVRQESWRYKRVKESWRRPRGLDNKMRLKVKGWPQSCGFGYRGPKEARGLHPSGYEEVLVYKPDDLNKIDSKTQAVRIAHVVGARKRAEVLAKASDKGIHVLNPGAIREIEEEAEKVEAESEEVKEAEEEKKMEAPKKRKSKRRKKQAESKNSTGVK